VVCWPREPVESVASTIVPKQWHGLDVAIFGHEDGHVVPERIVRSSFFFLQQRISDGYDTVACVCASQSVLSRQKQGRPCLEAAHLRR
jgi:hypothetical protein